MVSDDKWGTKSQHALDLEISASKARDVPATPGGLIVSGDGTWAWSCRIDGADIVVDHARITCFGGSNDPQDSGATASGISTKNNPIIVGCALPMDGRLWPTLTRREHNSLDGSGIPRVPWRTVVQVTIGDETKDVPVIDLGPGKRTGNALDLTIGAARLFDPRATATDFAVVGSYRIVGAEQYISA